MKNVVTCPACNATNKPRAVTCRVCGQRLVESREKPGNREPVVLQRVMTGEVFSAVVVPGADGVRVKERPRSALDEKVPPTKAPAPPPATRGLSDADVTKLLRDILALAQRGDYAQAVATADRILDEREEEPKALILKADALFRAGRRREAAEIFDVLIHIDPENAKIWLDRARIQKAMEQFPQALESYDAALALDGKVADAWYERATVLDALANATEALRSIAKALELKPDLAPAVALRVDLERRKSTAAVRAVADQIDREMQELEDRAQVRAAVPEAVDLDLIPDEAPAPAPETASVPESERAPARPVPPDVHVRAKDRMYTYVEGLDEALNGGIPEGHGVIVTGPPGTMKSSLCLSIAAYNAATERRPSLYITLEESRESLQVQARSLGLPFEDAGGLLMFLDGRDLRASVPRAGEDWVDAFAAALEALRSERPFELLVLDALEGLEAIARFPDRRRAIFRLFERLRDLSVTTLVIAERPDILFHGNVLYGRWSEDFLADGILHLRHHIVSDLEVTRRIRIVKMRGTRHETGYMAFLVDEGRLRATRAMAP